MERNPVSFAWRTAPALNLLALVLLALAFPVAWIGIDLVRVAVDDAVGGTVYQTLPFASFLRLQIDPPAAVADAPWILFAGFPLERRDLVLGIVAAGLAVALAALVLVLVLELLRARIGAKGAARLRAAVVEGLAAGRPSAREEARYAVALGGERLGRETDFLGSALIAPAAGIGALVLALLYAATVDWRLPGAVGVALILIALAWTRHVGARRAAAERRLVLGAAVRRALADLVRRMPAVRAHGTAPFERARLLDEVARPAPDSAQGGLAAGLAAAASLCGAVAVLGTAAWLSPAGAITPGAAAAVLLATAIGALGLGALVAWQRRLSAARPLFEELARALGALQARRGGVGAAAASLPGSGALVARGLAAYDPGSGARIGGVDLTIGFPAHVALLGELGGGARTFALVLAGQIDPSGGRITYGGVDLAAVDATERARRIAFAGGEETILVAGSLRDNLLYGCPDPDAPDIDRRVGEAAAVVGLDRLIHARGLSGTLDPARDPKLAAAVLDARRAVRTALAEEKLEALVEPFDPERYNNHAGIGENILFGVPLGDTFREEHLPAHPFVRAILEAEDLTKPLSAMGLSIASAMVEIFADIPDGHPLFERFGFFSAGERGYFEDLVQRQEERRRGAEAMRDRERLIGLALRYVETRHRLGLLDESLEARVLSARKAFANLLPTSLQPAIEFYRPGAICAAASLQDNLLFGRVAQDRAGAEAEVRRVVRRVLAERGLDQQVFRIGLDAPLDLAADELTVREQAAVDLGRCLVRRPDIVVVERALDGLTTAEADGLVARLRRALVGRGLVLAAPELSAAMDDPPFDAVVRFERGAAALEDRRRARTPEPAAA